MDWNVLEQGGAGRMGSGSEIPQLIQVAAKVADHLGDRVAAELLEEHVGQDEGGHRLADHAAAAMAVTSVRSTCASNGCLVTRSALLSGRGRVERGLTSAWIRISSPFDIPPSTPPAWLASRRKRRAAAS